MTPTVLDLAAARRWAVTSRSLLGEARERIDRLNVFPVPDGDTGTNMFLTVDGALGYLREQDESTASSVRLTDGLDDLAHAMLLSARGNSGVILSQLAQGMAQAVRASPGSGDVMGAAALSEAFGRAADLAWAAVSSPVEGTILSVARAAADGAAAAAAALDLTASVNLSPGLDPAARSTSAQAHATYAVAHQGLVAARAALVRTPEQLASLARAGVVDAGGAGFVLVLEALESVLSGRPHDAATPSGRSWMVDASTSVQAQGRCVVHSNEAGANNGASPDLAYEVMYLLEDASPDNAQSLRQSLREIGDSVMVVGGPAQYRVHVHLDHTSAALDAGSRAGRVEHVTITSLAPSPKVQTSTHQSAALGVVCCAPGEAIGDIFRQAGATVVPSSAGHRASTGELLEAARRCAGGHVAILPNDPDTILAAQAATQAAAGEGLTITVLPTMAVVQGLAAISVWDPTQSNIDEALEAMAQAASHVAYGALTIAVSQGQTPVGPCEQGQWLGLVGNDIASVDDTADKVMVDVLRGVGQLLGETPELLTIVMGARAIKGDVDEAVRGWIGVEDIEVRYLDGGQRTFHWLVGVE